MAHKAISQSDTSPEELVPAAAAAAEHGRRRIVRVHGKAIALIPHAERPRPRRKLFTKDDPLWKIVGVPNADGGLADVSDNVNEHPTEAYLDTCH